MSKICVTTNNSILIFVSTCKKITQSEPTEFSKNGVIHSKVEVIAFSNCLKLNANPTLHRVLYLFYAVTNFGTLQLYAILRHYYRKYIEIEFLKIFYLRKFWTSNAIYDQSFQVKAGILSSKKKNYRSFMIISNETRN